MESSKPVNNTQNTENIALQECKKKKKKKKSNRCAYLGCGKKIKHYMGPCKCTNTFCSKHRLPHQHECNIDYKTDKLDFIKNNGLGGGKFTQLEAI